MSFLSIATDTGPHTESIADGFTQRAFGRTGIKLPYHPLFHFLQYRVGFFLSFPAALFVIGTLFLQIGFQHIKQSNVIEGFLSMRGRGERVFKLSAYVCHTSQGQDALFFFKNTVCGIAVGLHGPAVIGKQFQDNFPGARTFIVMKKYTRLRHRANYPSISFANFARTVGYRKCATIRLVAIAPTAGQGKARRRPIVLCSYHALRTLCRHA